MKLKLAERTVGERMLVACIYDYIPSSGDNLYYRDMMRCVIDRNLAISLVRKPVEFNDDFTPKSIPPLTEEEEIQAKKIYEEDKDYQGKTLKVGNRVYPIYNSNGDGSIMPCGKAPEMEINKEELLEWEKEFAGEMDDNFQWKRKGWIRFDDELFLK